MTGARPGWLIAGGLMLVSAPAAGLPGLELTGVALIALGAAAELSRRPHAAPLVVAQAAVYGGLYLLFLGAMLHSAEGPLSLMAGVDAVLSIALMALHAPQIASLAQPNSP